jgi:hypothetical protein
MATATNFDRLLKLGQQKGGLTTDDLVRALPIEAMTVEEIASLITRLEGANVPVEVDPALLSPMHRATLRLKLKPNPDGGAGATRDGSHAPPWSRPPSGGVARSSTGNRWRTGPYQGAKVLVIAAAIIVVFVLVVVLVLSAFRVG